MSQNAGAVVPITTDLMSLNAGAAVPITRDLKRRRVTVIVAPVLPARGDLAVAQPEGLENSATSQNRRRLISQAS
eukprot:3850358-Pyramimonas_sp.AAC.1